MDQDLVVDQWIERVRGWYLPPRARQAYRLILTAGELPPARGAKKTLPPSVARLRLKTLSCFGFLLYCRVIAG